MELTYGPPVERMPVPDRHALDHAFERVTSRLNMPGLARAGGWLAINDRRCAS